MSKFQTRNIALSRRRIINAASVLVAGITAPTLLRIRSAFAAYPERPIKIVVANTPAGPSDLIGRITAAALEQSTGKTFIVENRGGALHCDGASRHGRFGRNYSLLRTYW